MRLVLILLMCCAIVSGTTQIAAACSPEDKAAYKKLAEQFCTFLKTDAPPSASLFTPDLIKEIALAQRQNDVIAKAHPDEKPPLGDGVPYQGVPDHAPVCQPGTNIHVDHQVYMEVSHQFPKDAKSNWTDRLKLVKTVQGWRIDDIVYDPDYDIGLRDVLTESFEK